MVIHNSFKYLSILNSKEIGLQLKHLNFDSFLKIGVTLLVLNFCQLTILT